MEILLGVAVGLLAGGMACWFLKSRGVAVSACLAVGVVGALLGLAIDKWLGDVTAGVTLSQIAASGIGAVLILFVWTVAQRLFLSQPEGQHHDPLKEFSQHSSNISDF